MPPAYPQLIKILKQFKKQKLQLLHVLNQPNCALTNNLSERDIREFVKRRKISGGTRSEAGKLCRDTFASLKKTCQKNGIKFWTYLLTREHFDYESHDLVKAMYSKYFQDKYNHIFPT